MDGNNRKCLFEEIEAASFAIDDVKLYLDTHPNDQEALAYYEKYKCQRQQKVEEYTNCFGPLTADNVNVENGWMWVDTPWPWEGKC